MSRRITKCRAGITTRPQARKKEWENEYPTLKNWRLFGPFDTRAEAQAWENRQYDCEKSGGGADPDSPRVSWYGYRFEYDVWAAD